MEGENRAFWEFCRADLKIPGPEKLSFDVFPKSCVSVSAFSGPLHLNMILFRFHHQI